MDSLTTATLEQHALATLRVLGLYYASAGDSAHARPQIESLTGNIRALGFALDHRHGTQWEQLLEYAQHQLAQALRPQQGCTTAKFLVQEALDLILTLKYSPADARLAQSGLGQRLITLAVATEHLVVLTGDAQAPGLPDCTSQPLSNRENAFLEVSRLVAAFMYHTALPLGHQPTAADVQAVVAQLREAMTHPGQEQGLGADLVIRQPLFTTDSWFRDDGFPNPSDTGDLVSRLMRSLVTANDSSLRTKHDGALALALEQLAALLAPVEQGGVPTEN